MVSNKIDVIRLCIMCGQDRGKGHKYCEQCAAKVDKIRRHESNRKRAVTGYRTRYKHKCVICGKNYLGWTKNSKFCSQSCYKKLLSRQAPVSNTYERAHGGGYCFMHRRIAEETLKRKLGSNEVIHHIDGNPTNNTKRNLIVLSRSDHAKLHQFLRVQRAILEQSRNWNVENCWETLIVSLTTTWLKTTSVKVIKIAKIGQSAAERLKRFRHDEGSEAMHDTSHAEDDMVQTATIKVGTRKSMR